MQAASPARLYATLVGAALTIAGIIGFFYEASFAVGDDIRTDKVFDILAVNGWHNVVHIATGALGLAVAGSYIGSRNYAIGLGAVYIGVAIWGFVIGDGESILSIIPINTEDNILHLLIAVAGLGAYAMSDATTSATSTTPAV